MRDEEIVIFYQYIHRFTFCVKTTKEHLKIDLPLNYQKLNTYVTFVKTCRLEQIYLYSVGRSYILLIIDWYIFRK